MQEASDIGGVPGIAGVRWPVPERIFKARADRFRSLAAGNVLRDYLNAMAALADAQHAALCGNPSAPAENPLPGAIPYDAGEWRRGGLWLLALKAVLSAMENAPLPPPARAALRRLSASPAAEIEAYADGLLAGNFMRPDLSTAPFVGAALQVYWTALAGTTPVLRGTPSRKACPVCGSLPVSGIILGDRKLRYLVCGLCSAEWYLPRLTCSHCGSTEGISYLSIEGGSGGAKAECCAQCRVYLKLLYREEAPAAEPFADDAATLALDTLISEEGFSRAGFNYYLLPGKNK